MPTISRNRRTLTTLLFVLLLTQAAGAARAQKLVTDPGSLYFSFLTGAAFPPGQGVEITLNTDESAPYAMTLSIGTWLQAGNSTGVTPDTLSVSVNPAGLAPGGYTDSISITSGDSVVVIPVTLYVRGPGSELLASPIRIRFTAVAGGAQPPVQLFTVRNFRGVQAPFAVVPSGEGWLRVTARSGLTTGVIEVWANQTGLLPGTYNGAINVMDPVAGGGIAATILVTLQVAGQSPLTVTPPSLSIQAQSGVSEIQSRNLLVYGLFGDATIYEARAKTTTGGNWLTVSPTAGVTNTVLVVTVNAIGLPVGLYSGSIVITTPERATIVPVVLTVTGGPAIVLSTNQLSFQSGGGQPAPPQTLFVDSLSGQALPITAVASGGDWLSVSPGNAATFAGLTVTASPAGLPPGTYSGLITITAEGSPVPAIVQVVFMIADVTTLDAEPTFLSYTAEAGAAESPSKTIQLGSSGLPLGFTAAATADWLTVSSSGTTTPATVFVSANTAALPVGRHQGSVIITAPGAGNNPVTIPVTVTVEEAVPLVAAAIHGASMTSGFFAPGTAIAIFGRRMGPESGVGLEIGPDGKVTRRLAGARALFDGIAGVMIYAQALQINAILPFELGGRAFVDLVVEYDGRSSLPRRIQLAEASPGIFTADSSGQGPGAILNQDSGRNGPENPAAANSVVAVYLTGGGQTNPPGVDGMITGGTPPRPALPVRAWVGGVEALVEYAGDAPGLVAGILQINIRIPAGLAPGSYPLIIEIGRFRSQLGVTVSLR